MNQEEQDALFEEVEKDNSLSDKAKDFWSGERPASWLSTLRTL
jgi:hypothetical protein